MQLAALHTMYRRRLLMHRSIVQNVIWAFFVTIFVFLGLFHGLIAWGAGGVHLAEEAPIRILAFGDSLTAGYGLDDPAKAFPAQLEAHLEGKGFAVEVLQGGVSGDTTTGGRSGVEWSLAEKPDAVIVALGGNDALRAVDPAITADNINFIVRRLQKDEIPVLIAGMLAPPNLGRDYGVRFNAIFTDVAEKSGAILYPFFLDGVVADPSLNQDDRIHPTAEGVAVIVSRISSSVEELIMRVKERRLNNQSKSHDE